MSQLDTRLYRLGVLLGGLCFCAPLFGCAEALPRELPEKEVGDALIRAERAAQAANKAATEAKASADKNAKLLEEARGLLVRAESARAECAGNYQRMQSAEAARRKAEQLRAERARKAAAAAAAARAAAEEAAVAEPPKEVDPEYSPSDAPIH